MCEKFQALVMEIFVLFTYKKRILAHSASDFVQQIHIKLILLEFHHPNNVDLMLRRKNICIQQSIPFKILLRNLSKLHIFLMANSPA